MMHLPGGTNIAMCNIAMTVWPPAFSRHILRQIRHCPKAWDRTVQEGKIKADHQAMHAILSAGADNA